VTCRNDNDVSHTVVTRKLTKDAKSLFFIHTRGSSSWLSKLTIAISTRTKYEPTQEMVQLRMMVRPAPANGETAENNEHGWPPARSATEIISECAPQATAMVEPRLRNSRERSRRADSDP